MTERLSNQIGQFTVIPDTVIEMIPHVGSNAFTLFCYLRYWSGKNNSAWPSYDVMQKDLGWSREKISAAIKALEENGLLERQKQFSASTIYVLKLPQKQEEQQPTTSPTAGDGIHF